MDSVPNLLRLTLVPALVVLFVNSAPAQWIRVDGLPIGETYAVLSSGDTLHVSVDSVVYVSEHADAPWRGTEPIRGLEAPITALLRLGNKVLVGTLSNGVHENPDGAVWTDRSDGLVGLGAKSISAMALRDSIVYVGTYGAGIFTAGGSFTQPWTAFNAGIPSNLGGNIYSLTNVDGILWAGAGANATVYRNVPASLSWEINKFAPFSPLGTSFLAVTSNRGMIHAVGSQGLHRSTDGGTTWSIFDPEAGFIATGGFAHTPNGLYAFLGKTSSTYLVRLNEDDSTWSRVDTGPGTTVAITYARNALFAARFDGLWKYDLTPTVIDVEPRAMLPGSIILRQNFPNPFNPSTSIMYELPTSSIVRLSVFDILGREVSVLVNERKNAGSYEVKFDGSRLASGVYLYRIQAGEFVQSKKLVLVR